MSLVPFHKPKVLDPDPKLPLNRRVVWEHFGDVRLINTWLLIISVLSLCLMLLLGANIFILVNRPPSVITVDQDGYVMWRSTDVFRLREDNIKMFLNLVLGKLFNSNPSYYDLSEITGLVHSSIIQKFANNVQGKSGERLRSDKRQVYTLYEVRRTIDPRYPKLMAFVTRGELTVYEEHRDASGNVRVYPQSDVVVWVAYLDPCRPTPADPWAFKLVGVEKRIGERAETTWNQSVPIAGSSLPNGVIIRASQQQPPLPGPPPQPQIQGGGK